MTTLRLGVLGGSFDPIHYGHLLAASEVADRLGLDRVIFCPAGEPWHKDADSRAPAEDRLRMVIAATADDARFTVSRVDVDRPGPTYTVDTLTELRADLAAAEPAAEAEWFFITGADALADVLRWREPTRIMSLAHLVGVSRPGHVLADPGVPDDAFTLVEIPGLDISSTDLRQRVRDGRPLHYLCPPAVIALIADLGLYAR